MNIVKKHSLIQKILIPILTLAIFLLPISPSLNLNKNGYLALGVKINKTNADEYDVYRNLLAGSTIKWNSSSSTTADFTVTINNQKAEMNNVDYISSILKTILSNYLIIAIFDKNNENFITSSDLSSATTNINGLTNVSFTWKDSWTIQQPVGNLLPDTQYISKLYYRANHGGNGGGENVGTLSTKNDYYKIAETPFNTGKADGGLVGPDIQASGTNVTDPTAPPPSGDYGCRGLDATTWFTNCIVLALYTVIWQPVAYIAEKAAGILDFFIYYSTNSTSYTSTFVTKGWGAVRDVANIFFIIALLYIAIKTILSLNVTNNKKIIGTIIVVALLINFSLFFTQVIIDGSNILAKVFYNNIVSKDSKGNVLPAKEGGEKSISVGLVDKFDPQTIITTPAESIGMFFVILLVSLAMLGYMIYMFLSVSLLFVSRVVMLWLSMIFAPIAFASYTLPFDIPGLGHKEWWKNLFENAFLAPIFIFMLYIIVMFGDFLKLITYENGSDKFMKTIIPFFILFVLLKKAKDMAVKYAGEMGAAINKAGAMFGGVALGAITGGAGLALSSTIGKRALNNYEGDKGEALREKAKEKGFGGWQARQRLKAMEGLAGGSFDFRKTAAGKKLGSISGMNLQSVSAIGLGSKEGGFKKRREDRVKRDQEWADKIGHVGEYSTKKQELKNAEMEYQLLVGGLQPEIARLGDLLTKNRTYAVDSEKKLNGALAKRRFKEEPKEKDYDDPEKYKADHEEWEEEDNAIQKAVSAHESNTSMVEALTTQLRSMKNGVNKEVAYVNKAGQIEGTVNYADPKSKFYALSSTGKTINNFEDVIIPTAKDEIHHVETHRKQAEGNRIAGKQKWYHDKQGNKEAGYRIITGAKTSTGGPKIKNDNVDHKPTAPKAETPKAPSAPTGGSPAGH